MNDIYKNQAVILDSAESLHNAPMTSYSKEAIGRMFINTNIEQTGLAKVYNDSGKVVGKKTFRQMTDAQGSIFFARQLEFIQQQVLQELFAPLKFRQLFPILEMNNAGYRSHTYRVNEMQGFAEVMGTEASDVPYVNLSGKEVITQVKSLGVGYRITQQELASANLVGLPLAQRNVMAARRAMEQLMNDISLTGLPAYNLLGLLTNPDIPIGNVPNGVGGNPQWSTKTPDEILKDINDAISEPYENSKGNHKVDTILLPIAQYELIRQTARSANSDTTILQYVQRNNPGVVFIDVPQLDGAGTAGVDVMIAYSRNPVNLEYVIGIEQQFLEPQLRGMAIAVPSWASTAGLVVKYPLSLTIKEDI